MNKHSEKVNFIWIIANLILDTFKRSKYHTLPGIVARYIVESETVQGQIQMSLIWKGTVVPNEMEQMQALDAFRQSLTDVFNWNTAQYNKGKVLIYI